MGQYSVDAQYAQPSWQVMIRLAHVTTIIAGIGSEYLSHHFRGVLYTESPASVHALLLLARCALRYVF
jgi:hypothetical protein